MITPKEKIESVFEAMPNYSDIPKEFMSRENKWNTLFRQWFYRGILELNLIPKEGINKEAAIRHIRAIINSWSPKHEHKEASVAFLLNEWFEGGSYKNSEGKIVEV